MYLTHSGRTRWTVIVTVTKTFSSSFMAGDTYRLGSSEPNRSDAEHDVLRRIANAVPHMSTPAAVRRCVTLTTEAVA